MPCFPRPPDCVLHGVDRTTGMVAANCGRYNANGRVDDVHAAPTPLWEPWDPGVLANKPINIRRWKVW